MSKRRWRKWNRVVHRDLGYLCVGLTVVYAISGIAVNHVRDWNPNYKVTEVHRTITPVTAADPRAPEVVRHILDELGAGSSFRDTYRPDASTLEIFLEDGTVTVELATGEAVLQTVRDRRGLKEANYLHLNNARGLWTYMADIYAAALLLLAVTGLFMLKGKLGITGRGAWLTAIGVAIPLLFLWLYM